MYEGYAWITIPKYKMDPSKSWEERYRELEKHHIEETSFLINEIRRLSKDTKHQAGLDRIKEQEVLVELESSLSL
jgi:hypothetical protein